MNWEHFRKACLRRGLVLAEDTPATREDGLIATLPAGTQIRALKVSVAEDIETGFEALSLYLILGSDWEYPVWTAYTVPGTIEIEES